VLVVALVAAVAPASAEPRSGDAGDGPAPADAAALLAGFGRTTGLEARFEEEKHLALLAAPLRSRGRLYFAPPATLLRRVETPHPQEVLVRGDRVRIVDDHGEQSFDLATRPGVRPLVQSMLWIFTGDRDALERTYRVDYEVLEASAEGGGRWQLELVPRGEPLSQIVESLCVRGAGRMPRSLELRETSGDRTVTRILEADPHRRFDAAERRRLFGDDDTVDGGAAASTATPSAMGAQ
jgi:outer membrane lipoprotein-sorting protein